MVATKLKSLRAITAEVVVQRLKFHNGNKNATCKSLGIAYHTLQGHLRRAGVSVERKIATN